MQGWATHVGLAAEYYVLINNFQKHVCCLEKRRCLYYGKPNLVVRVAFLTSPCGQDPRAGEESSGFGNALEVEENRNAPQLCEQRGWGWRCSPNHHQHWPSRATRAHALLGSLGSGASPAPEPRRSHSWATGEPRAPALMLSSSARFTQHPRLCCFCYARKQKATGEVGEGVILTLIYHSTSNKWQLKQYFSDRSKTSHILSPWITSKKLNFKVQKSYKPHNWRLLKRKKHVPRDFAAEEWYTRQK